MGRRLRAWLGATDAHAPLCISDGDVRDDPANPMNSAPLNGNPVSAADCF